MNQKKFPPPARAKREAAAFPDYPFSPPAVETATPPTPDELPVIDAAEPEPTETESADALGLSQTDYHLEVCDEEQQRHPLSPDDSGT